MQTTQRKECLIQVINLRINQLFTFLFFHLSLNREQMEHLHYNTTTAATQVSTINITDSPISNNVSNPEIPRTAHVAEIPRHPGQISIAVQSVPSSLPQWGFPPLSDTLAAQHFFLNRLVTREHRHLRDEMDRQTRPQFRSKIVCMIHCKHCHSAVCKRGMKAILLADMNVF